MARAVKTDFFQNCRFMMRTVGPIPRFARPGDIDFGVNGVGQQVGEAGFSQMSSPSVSVDPVEYREGTFNYTRKYPGIPTMEDITFQRGVARRDNSFAEYMMVIMEGAGNYRDDFEILHFHRDTALTRAPNATQNQVNIDVSSPGKIYHCFECWPSTFKVAGDFDATSADISIMEGTLVYEYFQSEELPVPA